MTRSSVKIAVEAPADAGGKLRHKLGNAGTRNDLDVVEIRSQAGRQRATIDENRI
jgi:hypothetical protein